MFLLSAKANIKGPKSFLDSSSEQGLASKGMLQLERCHVIDDVSQNNIILSQPRNSAYFIMSYYSENDELTFHSESCIICITIHIYFFLIHGKTTLITIQIVHLKHLNICLILANTILQVTCVQRCFSIPINSNQILALAVPALFLE